MNNAKGDVMKRNFIQKYSVIPAPNTATVAADLMNVLYAGFRILSVSVCRACQPMPSLHR